ncbi:MAG TPA: preprotein translocase subunit SecA, partial [Alphaproteobacteria bacterium]|nr:preprotein translocase subunit SecA [Alphaproteobacteria bacterium]
NFDIRKNLLKYDDVMNEQRKVIYAERKKLMETDDVSESVFEMREECLGKLVDNFLPYGSDKSQWQTEALQQELAKTTGFVIPVVNWANEDGLSAEDMKEKILAEVEKDLKEKNASVPEDIVKMVDKSILLQTLDFLWKEHIATLDQMRHTIVLRAYGQKDPLNEYKKEAFNMFSDLLDVLKEQVTVVTCRTLIKANSDEKARQAEERAQNMKTSAVHEAPENVLTGEKQEDAPQPFKNETGPIDPNNPSTWGKVARNDLCPCGSGKKYKHCHGKIS